MTRVVGLAGILVFLASGCGGSAGGADRGRPDAAVVFDSGLDKEPGHDPGQDDHGAETEPADPGTGMDTGMNTDESPADPGNPPADPGAVDPGPLDPGPPDPGPADAGFEGTVGQCKPDDPTCWCEHDGHCDPAFHQPCRPNACNLATHRCAIDLHLLDGLKCEDGEPCTQGDTCQAGACTGGEWTCQCKVAADCDDKNPCTDDSCTGGSCRFDPNTVPCDDGDGCTSGDTCSGGKCVPGAKVCDCDSAADCDDGNVCTADSCDPAGSCVHDPALGPCDDNNTCTSGDSCKEGVCVPGTKTCECEAAGDCDDANPCTDDACQANACVHSANAAPCDDGDACTMPDACAGGACKPGPVACAKCGDGTCFKAGETCASCPDDCGACPATETACADLWDDDGDGKIDCDDPDCQGKPPCLPDTCKKIDQDVGCGFWDNWVYASGNDVTGTACGESLSSIETVYRFKADADRKVTVRVDPDAFSDDNWELYVLAGACNPAACIGADTWGFYWKLTFQAEAGKTYYFVVEEYWATNGFDIEVTCE
jgi:hypothetical protein